MMGETNSMVGYHLVAEDHSIQLGIWGGVGGGGTVSPHAGAGQGPGGG